MASSWNFTRRAAGAALIASWALFAAGIGHAAEPAEAAKQVIEEFHTTLLAVMKDAEHLGYEGRYKKLEPAIKQTFNVPLMTEIVVGSAWRNWSTEQRDQVSQAFGRFITATYARRFDGFSGEKFVIDGTRPANNGVLVTTHIVRPNDSPVTLNYLTRDNGAGTSQVVDVFLTGTISELATRRSEFGAVLQREGYQGLLKALADKANSQGGP